MPCPCRGLGTCCTPLRAEAYQDLIAPLDMPRNDIMTLQCHDVGSFGWCSGEIAQEQATRAQSGGRCLTTFPSRGGGRDALPASVRVKLPEWWAPEPSQRWVPCCLPKSGRCRGGFWLTSSGNRRRCTEASKSHPRGGAPTRLFLASVETRGCALRSAEFHH